MAYCSECGVYYTNNEAVCTSCGRNLKQEPKSETETTPTVNTISSQSDGSTYFKVIDDKGNNVELTRIKEVLEQNNISIENDSPSSPTRTPVKPVDAYISNNASAEDRSVDYAYFQIDSHLGKGIIKPQKVELASDGVHFKYDTPSHNFIKAEPVKEKPREYRVTDSDMEAKKAENIYIAKENLNDGVLNLQENLDEEVQVAELTRESEVNGVSEVDKAVETSESQIPVELESPNNEYVPEIMTDEDVYMTYGPKSIPEPEIANFLTESSQPEEPVLRKERELVWEGTQTWYKIPFGNIYRLTGRYLIILGKFNNKLLEVDLAMITAVTVRQSWLAKLLGVGDLLITIPEFSATKVVLGGISKPHKVRQIIEELCHSVNNLTINSW